MSERFEPGAWRQQAPEKIESDAESLRERIKAAEKREDETEIVLLEAELRAKEAGLPFDRANHIKPQIEPKGLSRHAILRRLQKAGTSSEDDVYSFDGVFAEHQSYKTYEATFGDVIEQLGYENLADLAKTRSEELGRKLTALDLFGGGYFLEDLEPIRRMTGVRLKDVDDELIARDREKRDTEGNLAAHQRLMKLEKLVNDSRRQVIEGNIYEPSTWKEIREKALDGAEGFDLILCRPMGMIGQNPSGLYSIKPGSEIGTNFEEVYAAMLDRTLHLLSKDGGILITQVPIFGQPSRAMRQFWERYLEEKEDEGFDFFFEGEQPATSLSFAVRRNAERRA